MKAREVMQEYINWERERWKMHRREVEYFDIGKGDEALYLRVLSSNEDFPCILYASYDGNHPAFICKQSKTLRWVVSRWMGVYILAWVTTFEGIYRDLEYLGLANAVDKAKLEKAIFMAKLKMA